MTFVDFLATMQITASNIGKINMPHEQPSIPHRHGERKPSSLDRLIELGKVSLERPGGLTVKETLGILSGDNLRPQLEAIVSTDRPDGFNETSGEQGIAVGKVPEAVVGVDGIGEQPPVLIVDEETTNNLGAETRLEASGDAPTESLEASVWARDPEPTTGLNGESRWGNRGRETRLPSQEAALASNEEVVAFAKQALGEKYGGTPINATIYIGSGSMRTPIEIVTVVGATRERGMIFSEQGKGMEDRSERANQLEAPDGRTFDLRVATDEMIRQLVAQGKLKEGPYITHRSSRDSLTKGTVLVTTVDRIGVGKGFEITTKPVAKKDAKGARMLPMVVMLPEGTVVSGKYGITTRSWGSSGYTYMGIGPEDLFINGGQWSPRSVTMVPMPARKPYEPEWQDGDPIYWTAEQAAYNARIRGASSRWNNHR